MLSGVLALLLCLSLREKSGLWSVDYLLPDDRHFWLGIWANLVINKYTRGRFEEWDNTVFQMNSKNVGRETELRLSRLPEFYRSEALQQAEARSTKIVCQAELFDRVESRNLLKSVLLKWIVKVRILHLDLSKSQTVLTDSGGILW